MTPPKPQMVRARELQPGDVILHPRCTIKEVFLPKGTGPEGTLDVTESGPGEAARQKVQITFVEFGGSGVYNPNSKVGIKKRKKSGR